MSEESISIMIFSHKYKVKDMLKTSRREYLGEMDSVGQVYI